MKGEISFLNHELLYTQYDYIKPDKTRTVSQNNVHNTLYHKTTTDMFQRKT